MLRKYIYREHINIKPYIVNRYELLRWTNLDNTYISVDESTSEYCSLIAFGFINHSR